MRQTEYTGVNLFHNAEEGVKMNSEKWMTLNDPTERIVYACNPSGMNFIKHYLFGVNRRGVLHPIRHGDDKTNEIHCH